MDCFIRTNYDCDDTFKYVTCGGFHSVAIKVDVKIVTWGSNNNDQCENAPVGKFKMVACGRYHSVGIKEDGKVVTWGSNKQCQYGFSNKKILTKKLSNFQI